MAFFFGNNSNNIFNGTNGLDLVFGRGGDDTIFGFGGVDLIFAGSGNDYVDGGDGNDSLYGGSGNDQLFGGAGNDFLSGQNGDDILDGGLGSDRLYGGNGMDSLSGGAGNDSLYGGRGSDVLDGGDGADRLYGNSGDDILDGGAGNDRLYGGSGDDILDGGTGVDILRGGSGHDSLTFTLAGSEDGRSSYRGDSGIDTLIINLTASEYSAAGVIEDLIAYLDYIAANTRSNGQVSNRYFNLDALNLRVGGVEFVEIYVDGVLTDPTAVTAEDDAFTTDEDSALSADVSSNDMPADGVIFTLLSTVESGTLTLNPDGTFSFDPDGAFEALDTGDSATETFTYEISNGFTTDTATVTITIEGRNDAPVVSAISEVVSEDASGYSVDLLSTASDVDMGDVLSVSNLTQTSGAMANVALSGSTLNVDLDDFQYLAAGESETLTFTYDVSDGDEIASNIFTLTIEGENDDPTVDAALSASATEDDMAFSVDLLAGAMDIDASDSLSVTNIALDSGDASGVSVNGDSLDIDPSAYNALAVGESVTIVYSFDIEDGNGGVVSQTATVTITGENDAPTVDAAIEANATEDDASFSVDLLTGASDVDTSDSLSAANITLESGDDSGVTINGNSLDIDPSAYDYLAVGEDMVITYSFLVEDGNGGSVSQTATITITGENDAPMVEAAIEATATEDDAVFSVDLLDGAFDIDSSDSLSVTNLLVVSGDDSGVSINGDSLDVDPSVYDALAVGETAEIVYSYDIIDGNGGTVSQTATITITGENDAPTVVSEVAGFTFEDDETFSLNLLEGATDVDASDSLSVENLTLLSGDASGVSVNGNNLDVDLSAYQSLAAGDVETLIYSYLVSDGNGGTASQTATLVIVGENDAPTISGAVTADIDNDSETIFIDLLTGASDVDIGDELEIIDFEVVSGDDIGVFDNGNNVEVDPSAYDYLAPSETEVIVINYTIIDGAGGEVAQTATLTITGAAVANSAPSISGPVLASATEDAAIFTVDLLDGASDVDGDILNITNLTLIAGDNAGVTQNGNALDVDPSAYDSLAVGESVDISYSYDIEDGNGGVTPQTAVLTITGANDAPTFAAALSADVSEAASAFTLDLLDGASDVDASDTLMVVNFGLLSGDDSGVTFNGDSLDIDPSVYADLVVGESEVISYQYDIIDGNGGSVTQTATITINGQGVGNSPPVVSGEVIVEESEGGPVFTVDLLDGASDVDGDTLSVNSIGRVSGDDGGVFFNGTTLDVDPDYYNYLPAGAFEDIVYQYDIEDGQGGSVTQTATITIIGENDVPFVEATIDQAVVEDASAVSIDMLDGAFDMDDGDSLSVENVDALPDGITFDGTDTLTIDPTDAAFQSLAEGETLDIIIGYDIVDTDGASVSQTITFTVTGTNDDPTVTSLVNSVTEGDGVSGTTDVSGNLLNTASDIDGDTVTVTSVNGTVDGVSGAIGTYGLLVWDATSGAYTYQLDDSNADIQAMVGGDTLTETFTLIVEDGNGGTANTTLSITINGRDDGIFTNQTDVVDLTTAATVYGEAGFNGNVLDAQDGDDNVVLFGAEPGFDAVLDGTTFMGGAGDDTILPLNDFMNADGGDGVDTLDFSQLTDQASGVTVNLETQTLTGAASFDIANFENVVGTDGNDTLTGSVGSNVLIGGAGDDTFIVATNADGSIDGFEGGIGNDTLDNNGAENLRLGSFTGFETVNLGSAGRSLVGTDDAEIVDLSGISFREASTTLLVDAGAGDDQIIGISTGAINRIGFGVTRETYDLGEGNDSFTGFDAVINEAIFGGLGDDTINGGGGNDHIYGGEGADMLMGGVGNDDFFVDSATDNTQTDTYLGDDGADRLINTGTGNLRLDSWDSSDASGTVSGSGVEDIRLNGFAVEGSSGDDSYNFINTQFEQVNGVSRLAFDGGAGNDTILASDVGSLNTIGFGGFTRYNLGEGNDSFTAQGSVNEHIYGGDGDDMIDAGDGNDRLYGGAGADTLMGGAGSDDFYVDITDDTQTDTYLGGDGTDRLINTEEGTLRLDNWDNFDPNESVNGAGVEQIRVNGFHIEGSTGDDYFDFGTTQIAQVDSITRLALDTGAGNDTVIGSSAAALSVIGFGGLTRYNLGSGEDSFTARGDIDEHIYGEDGDDIIDAGEGNDRLIGGAGSDTLMGGAGSDQFYVDSATDDTETDLYLGGLGDDRIVNTGEGNIRINNWDSSDPNGSSNGSGIEEIYLNGFAIEGSSGDDSFNFGATRFREVDNTSRLVVEMGAGNDTVIGSSIAAINVSGFGTSVVYDLGAGNDTFTGSGNIADHVENGAGDDIVSTGEGTDTLFAGLGVDQLFGGAGSDDFIIRAGDDYLNDLFVGGEGNSDDIINQTGGDLVFTSYTGGAHVEGSLVNGNGIENIQLATQGISGTDSADSFDLSFVRISGADISRTDAETNALINMGDGDDVVIGAELAIIGSNGFGFNGTYNLGAGNDVFTSTSNLVDIIFDGAGDDIVSTGAGGDIYVGGSGNDVVDLGAGFDVVSVRHQTEFGFDTFSGGTGIDLIDNVSGGDFAIGGLATGSGFESINTDGFAMTGTSGNDVFDLTGVRFLEVTNGQTILSTGDGNDTVIASNLSAILNSGFGASQVAYDLGAGDDTYFDSGNLDANVITGGTGDDTFVFNDGWGDDVITDFDALSDFEIIDFSAVSNIDDFADLLANHMVQDGADVVITEGGNTLTLEDVNLSDLDANDFLFDF